MKKLIVVLIAIGLAIPFYVFGDIQHPFSLNDLVNVKTQMTAVDNDVLTWDSASGLWINSSSNCYEKHTDLNILGGLRQNSPDEVIEGTATGLGFDAENEEAYIRWHTPEDWDGASDMSLHIHWFPATTMAEDDNVYFDLTYRTKSAGEDVSGGNTTVATTAFTQVGTGTLHGFEASYAVIDYDDTDNPLTAHDEIMIIINRNLTAELATYAANAVIETVHMAYTACGQPD